MISHHFVGAGRSSERLRSVEPSRLLALVTERVVDCGLGVVVEQAVPFDNGGLTLVWVLAESHLVLHLWPEDGYATVDLHVCATIAPPTRTAPGGCARSWLICVSRRGPCTGARWRLARSR